jgi:hypothetical protein
MKSRKLLLRLLTQQAQLLLARRTKKQLTRNKEMNPVGFMMLSCSRNNTATVQCSASATKANASPL